MPTPMPPSPILNKQPAEEIGLIQGQTPDSINEWYVSLALDRLEIPYDYQYPLGGGTEVRGGQVIDFVVYPTGSGIPVFVQGAYWHDTRHDPEGQLKQAAAQARFGTMPVLLEEHETDTQDHAYRAVLEKIK